MSEFFGKPNEPTLEELQRAQQRQAELNKLQARTERRNAKFSELRAAVTSLAEELKATGIPPSLKLLETPKAYPTNVIVQKITGRYWRYDEPRQLGNGWIISTKHYHSVGAQDGYSASMNGSDSSATRTIVLTEDAKLGVGQVVYDGTLMIWGEIDQTSFELVKSENAVPLHYDGGLFKTVDLDEFERDLRSSGRELLGYN